MSYRMPSIILTIYAIVALAALAGLSGTTSRALAQENSPIPGQQQAEEQTAAAGGNQTNVRHLANGTITLQSGEEKVVSFDIGSNTTTISYVTGHASVQGGVVWIRITAAEGNPNSGDGFTQVAIYSKDTPMSDYDDGNFKTVNIPVRAGTEQLVLYAPSPDPAIITYDFDIVHEEKGDQP